MTDTEAIRSAAARCRAEAGLPGDEPLPSAQLLERVRGHRGLKLKRFRPNGVRGPEVLGTLNAFGGMIHVAARLPDPEAAFVEAHEIGHHVLHPDIELALREQSTHDRRTPHGTWAAIGYSDRERLEADADAFAAELLCPARWLRTQLEHHGRRPSDVAATLSVPVARVVDQAIASLLANGPPTASPTADDPVPKTNVDAGSRTVVVEAAPGAGATTMAVSRVAALLGRGVAPAHVLVLAPTEGMVGVLRSRMASSGCARAGHAWTGTPANLGFELVAKNARSLGRSARFRLLDETGARTLFGEARARMAPHLPASEAFRLVLDAKRRMVDPAAWREAAEADIKAAQTEPARDRARKAVDLASAWAAYEEYLTATDAIDEADLSAMPVRLLHTVPGALADLRGRFRHVIVDGLHDLGAAALEIVRLLAAGPGSTVWATGDPRRRIDGHARSRFQGFDEFATAIGASKVELPTDRLRVGPLARIVADARARDALRAPGRVDSSPVGCGSRRARAAEEARAIAAEVERNRLRGIPIAGQVVLAHSHGVLRRISRELAKAGVAIDAVPDLRDEGVVRDLLAIAAFATEGDEASFLHVASLEEYDLPERDATPAKRWLKAPERGMPRGLSPAGRAALTRLRGDFRGLDRGASAAEALKTWLFERSGYLGRMFREPDVVARNRNLASIHHLLRIAEEHEAQGDRSHAMLRDRVRWAGGLRQSTAFKRARPAGGEALGVMTINAARGHRFEAVHLAGVTRAGMGIRARPTMLWPPLALASLWGGTGDPAEAELALFRVAVSRATSCLHMPGSGFRHGRSPGQA